VVNYWDASALVAMLARSPAAAGYRAIASQSRVVTWWGSFVECACAIARRAREGSAPSQTAESYRLLDLLAEDWREIQPSERLRRTAIRIAKNHPLRAADALHLAAALLASGFEPHSVRFLTEDARLKQAAEGEGFIVS
jgi:uncharacterized protein